MQLVFGFEYAVLVCMHLLPAAKLRRSMASKFKSEEEVLVARMGRQLSDKNERPISISVIEGLRKINITFPTCVTEILVNSYS